MDSYLFSEGVLNVLKYALLAIGVVLAVLTFIVIPLTNTICVAQGEGEIVEISDFGVSVVVQHVTFLNINETIINPIGNITAGVCSEQVNQYYRCNIGAKVRISKYSSAIADWWSVDSIIKSYSNSTGFIPIS